MRFSPWSLKEFDMIQHLNNNKKQDIKCKGNIDRFYDLSVKTFLNDS